MNPEQERNVLIALGIIEPEPEPVDESDDQAPDFDGGVRQTAPAPIDPYREHDELMAELASLPRPTGGDLEW